MATATLSGYLAELTACTFSGTQTLASLADNEWSDLSDAINNSTNKWMMADFEIFVDFATTSAAATDNTFELYIVPSADGGTTYGDWTGNSTSDQQQNNQYYVGSVTISQSAADETAILRSVALPNGYFKVGVRNRTGGALDSTPNSTVSYRPWGYASN